MLFETEIKRIYDARPEYAPIKWSAANDPLWAVEHPEETQSIFESGQLPPRGEKDGEFVAHFATPDEGCPLVEKAGFQIGTILGSRVWSARSKRRLLN